MCAICGCGSDSATVLDLRAGPETRDHMPGHHHGHDHQDDHTHPHEHAHDHQHGGTQAGTIELEARILAKNDALAERNRGWFAGREILALNLVGAPGAGKTALIERTIGELRSSETPGDAPLFVIEGDQASSLDGERIRKAGAPVVQVNTGTGCHLDAAMVAQGLSQLRPSAGALVLIENVGNLVCPALFDLGEQAKIVLFSVAEGAEKPLKYPHMFRVASLVLLNKIDLLPYLDFEVERALANLRAVNPVAPVLHVSARTGEGIDEWLDWLRRQQRAVREKAF